MSTPINTTKQDKARLPLPEHAFEWPQKAMLDHQWSEAAQRWAVLREAYPKDPATWIQGAISHIEADDLKQAELLLKQARQNFPTNPNTLLQSAEVAVRREAWNTADEFLKQARQQFPDYLHTWIKSANCAERQGNLEQALAYNKKARRIEPDNPTPFIQYAELAMHAKQWAEAMERWETVRTRFPDVPDGYLRAAEAARRLNRSKEARRLLLVQQYGTDIFDNASDIKNTSVPQGNTKILGQFLELVWTKAIFNLRSEVNRNYLSYGWWILEPLLYMIVYYVVFGLLLQRGGEDYTGFLLTGLIPWMWFSKAVSGSSNSILTGQNLMLQAGLPSIFFPLVNLLQVTIKQLPIFFLLLGFLWLQGFIPTSLWWILFPVIFVQIILMMAIACAVAAIIPFVRDLSYLVPTGLTFLMFLSGIFYDYRIIPDEWQSVFLLNPVAFLLKCYREIFVDGILPDLQTLALWGLGSIAACLLLLLAYQRLRYIYPRIVME